MAADFLPGRKRPPHICCASGCKIWIAGHLFMCAPHYRLVPVWLKREMKEHAGLAKFQLAQSAITIVSLKEKKIRIAKGAKIHIAYCDISMGDELTKDPGIYDARGVAYSRVALVTRRPDWIPYGIADRGSNAGDIILDEDIDRAGYESKRSDTALALSEERG